MTVPTTRFRVLGVLEAERDGVAISVSAARQQCLLSLLLMSAGTPVPRDRLISELWGETPPSTAASALHVHLSKLRAQFGGLIVGDSRGYRLQAGAFELDALRFEELVDAARADRTRARSLLNQALDLFHGEPLADVPVDRALLGWRRELESQYMEAILLRIEADLDYGLTRELVPELQALVIEHPFVEQLWSHLILALYRSERQVDALDTYQRARRLFDEQLGLDLGAPLRTLQARILAHDPSLQAPSCPVPAHAPATLAAVPAEDVAPVGPPLPSPTTRLVGRDADLHALAGIAIDPDTRLITLRGQGGVGKTRLALAHGSRYRNERRGPVLFVALEHVTKPAGLESAIGKALDAAGLGGRGRGRATRLADDLRDRDALLILDNFEHLMPAASFVSRLLCDAPDLQVLVTSRAPLRVRGERVFDVGPLGLPDPGQDPLASPAVQLFLQSALSGDRTFTVDEEASETVAAICAAVDGVPLAVELAAAQLRRMSLAELETHTTEWLSIGTHALRDLPDRQQSLSASVRWSYDLVSPSAQRTLLRAVTSVGDGLTRESLSARNGTQVGLALVELLDAGLIEFSAFPGHFRVPELVRAFLRSELDAAGQVSELSLAS